MGRRGSFSCYGNVRGRRQDTTRLLCRGGGRHDGFCGFRCELLDSTESVFLTRVEYRVARWSNHSSTSSILYRSNHGQGIVVSPGSLSVYSFTFCVTGLIFLSPRVFLRSVVADKVHASRGPALTAYYMVALLFMAHRL